MRLRGHMIAKNVEEDLVGCQTVLVMRKLTQYVRPKSRSGIGKGLIVLPQPKMFPLGILNSQAV